MRPKTIKMGSNYTCCINCNKYGTYLQAWIEPVKAPNNNYGLKILYITLKMLPWSKKLL